jgi:uncharacterized protein YlxP (DUF503 family)
MVVGVCLLDIHIPANNSLKGKRQVLRQIIERTKNKFNVAIAEVGDNELWQRAKLGFSVVGNDQRHVNSMLDNVRSFIEGQHIAEVLDSEWEILHY